MKARGLATTWSIWKGAVRFGFDSLKINGTAQPHVLAAQRALEALVVSLVPIVQKLHRKDLELLTDLIFRQSGWNRIGVTGGTTKDIDLDLLSPLTGERIAVQIKINILCCSACHSDAIPTRLPKDKVG